MHHLCLCLVAPGRLLVCSNAHSYTIGLSSVYILTQKNHRSLGNLHSSPSHHHRKVESESHLVVSDSLQPHGLYSPWNSPGQNDGMCSLSLLPHCPQILYLLSHKGSPRILGWVAYPFSRGSSPLRNRTGVSCIAGGFFTN